MIIEVLDPYLLSLHVSYQLIDNIGKLGDVRLDGCTFMHAEMKETLF